VGEGMKYINKENFLHSFEDEIRYMKPHPKSDVLNGGEALVSKNDVIKIIQSHRYDKLQSLLSDLKAIHEKYMEEK
jgi:hypothetical protein